MTILLFIPGLVSDRFVWEASLAALSDKVCAVADVSWQSSIPEMAMDLLDRHAGQIIAVGHSMGGRVAMEMARIAPSRIEALALLNTGIHPKRDHEEIKRQQMIDLAWEHGMGRLAQVWLPLMLNSEREPDVDQIAALTAMVCRMTPKIHERQMRALLSRPDASLTIGAYRKPMLLIVGRHDIWSPIAQHEDIQRLCPQARLEIIEDAGHFAPVEQPAAVATCLASWIGELAREDML